MEVQFPSMKHNGLAMSNAGLESTSLSAYRLVCLYSFTFNLALKPALRIAFVSGRFSLFFNHLSVCKFSKSFSASSLFVVKYFRPLFGFVYSSCLFKS